MNSRIAPLVAVAGALVQLGLASQGWGWAHAAAAALVAGVIAFTGLAAASAAKAGGGSAGRAAGICIEHAAWLLLAIAFGLATTYTLVLKWDEWWQFLGGASVLAVLSMLLGRALASDASKGADDAAMLIIARFWGWCVLLAGAAAAIGLVADRKLMRFAGVKHTDWAANSTFFFGAIGLATLSYVVLKVTQRNGKT